MKSEKAKSDIIEQVDALEGIAGWIRTDLAEDTLQEIMLRNDIDSIRDHCNTLIDKIEEYLSDDPGEEEEDQAA